MPPSSSAQATAAKTRAQPYRDFLTPALHRKFMGAALSTLAVCYIAAVWMGEWSLFWQWFPLGLAGVRTLLLFIAALFVYLLRISELRIGGRDTSTPFRSILTTGCSLSTVMAVVWYNFSAWWYLQIYLFSCPTSDNVGWTESRDKHKLNERAIMLRAYMVCFACAQAAVHVLKDHDRVRLPIMKTTKAGTSPVLSARTKMTKAIPGIVIWCAVRAVAIGFSAPIIYFTLLRPYFWAWSFRYINLFQKLVGSAKYPMGANGLMDLIIRATFQGFFLNVLWEFTNEAFSVYVAQEPLKNGTPLTSESKDPDGSLLNGLKSKKEIPRSFAFWEVNLISLKHKSRRETIYRGIHREPIGTWKQILHICLAEINIMTANVRPYIKNGPAELPFNPDIGADGKISPKRDKDKKSSTKSGEDTNSIKTLPRIAKPLSSNGDIISPAASPDGLWATTSGIVDSFIKAAGTPTQPSPASKGAPSSRSTSKSQAPAHASPFSPDKILSQIQSVLPTSVPALGGILSSNAPVDLPMSLAVPSPQLAAASIAFGSEPSRAGSVADAANAAVNLACASIKEDPYGTVFRDVPPLLRSLVVAVRSLDSFRKEVRSVTKARAGRGEVDDVLMALKEALGTLLGAWGEYTSNLRIDKREWKEAKDLQASAGIDPVPPPARSSRPSASSRSSGSYKSDKRKSRGEQPEMEQVSSGKSEKRSSVHERRKSNDGVTGSSKSSRSSAGSNAGNAGSSGNGGRSSSKVVTMPEADSADDGESVVSAGGSSRSRKGHSSWRQSFSRKTKAK